MNRLRGRVTPATVIAMSRRLSKPRDSASWHTATHTCSGRRVTVRHASTALRVPSSISLPESRFGDHLRSGDVFVLLPLSDFLRAVTGYSAWSRVPTRATFLIDDPNLHWRTYGYVRFQELAEAASAHGYHVTFATVPLDSWFAWPSVARLFRANDPSLSLAAHGVYHLHEELAAPEELDDAVRALWGAAARLDRFERRFGVPVGRVMIPPHGWSTLGCPCRSPCNALRGSL